MRWLPLLLVACDPFHADFADVEPAQLYQASALRRPALPRTRLVVMSYNAKFGGARIDFFFDCYGNRVLMTESEVLHNLEGLAAKINQVDPDVLLMQEVDVNSKRAAFVDQLQWLLDHTQLSYGAYASQWRADYVPSDGIGPVDSGNAILARWPLLNAERLALPLQTEQDSLTRYFYPKRNLLRARLAMPGRDDLWILATHTDAYGKDGTKKLHIDRFIEAMDTLSANNLVIAGGDLNTLPPGTVQQHQFNDSVCADTDFIADDYRAEATYLEPLYARYGSAIPLADYQADNARYYTHTVDGRGYWNRTLDYLFSSGTWQPGSGLVHQSVALGGMDTMPLSDHAPLTGVLELP